MTARGLYRFKMPMSGIEWAAYSEGEAPHRPTPYEIEREVYEGRQIYPPYDQLPTREQWEQNQRRHPLRER